MKYIDSNMVNDKFKELIKKREKEFISYFKERSVENHIKVYPPENNIPFNGFSFYKINYKGEFPKYLIKAYADINELNNESPRKKFKKIRERTKEGF